MIYTSGDRQCPYCDAFTVRPMPPQLNEAESRVAWYECEACHHIWHLEKPIQKIRTKPHRERPPAARRVHQKCES